MSTSKAELSLNKHIDVQTGPLQLHIGNAHGDINIVATERDQVTVEAHIEYDAAQWSAAQVREMLTLHCTDNQVVLLVARPVGVTNLRADLVVQVPQRAALTVDAGYGDVTASGLHSDIDIKTTLGKVWLDGGRGAIVLVSSNGTIETRNVRPSDRLFIQTSLGDIHYRGELAEHENHIETAKGDIGLGLPANSQFRLRASTEVGRVRNGFSMSGSHQVGVVGAKMEGGTLSVGNNAPLLNLYSRLGDIHLQQIHL